VPIFSGKEKFWNFGFIFYLSEKFLSRNIGVNFSALFLPKRKGSEA